VGHVTPVTIAPLDVQLKVLWSC